jgi:hypothetical protein
VPPFLHRTQVRIEALEAEFKDVDTAVPSKLATLVRAALRNDPAKSWDEAIWELAEKGGL